MHFRVPAELRSCLTLGAVGSETRRQAASDFTKALMEQFESQITAIVTQYIGVYLGVSCRLGGVSGVQRMLITIV